MLILAINVGSQSLKYKLYEKEGDLTLLQEGLVKDIGFGGASDHKAAFEVMAGELKDHKDKIEIIGHRYVSGGQEFVDPLVVDEKAITALEKYNDLAPLHNPFNLLGLKMALEIFPGAKNVAIFDTYFYKDLPAKAYRYALNKEVAEKNGYRRLGFHGTSHRFCLLKAAEELGKEPGEVKVISLHLGGGASITAAAGGKAVDTSMGYTPMEGLCMMTRSGDIDPGVILDLMEKGMKAGEIKELLNKKSGLFGLCGQEGMLGVLDNLSDPITKEAFEVYIYRIQKYIGAYFAVLGGCDALVFTGTVGAGRKETREAVLADLGFLEKAKVLVIETDEERMIAADAFEALEK